jgi:formylglycine-generating enzyme required for sulfatase activity
MSLKLWTDLVDDASVNTLPENGMFKSAGSSFITKKNPFAYDADRLIIADGCAVDIYNGEAWRQVSNRGDIDFNPVQALDMGNSFQVGKDYYIYMVVIGNTVELVVSPNSTYPDGYTAQNSRKIGGFHYGHIRKVSPDGKWVPIDSAGAKYGAGATPWQNNVTVGIVPNSVWDLKNRPKCSPEGMVKIAGRWFDIYEASAVEPITVEAAGLSVVSGKLQSKYGQVPVTGTEGLNWYGFAELASLTEKEMLSYAEFIAAARGNPQGEAGADNYGWAKGTNTGRQRTGCNVDGNGNYVVGGGVKPFAVSAMNCVDTVGNVWEWLNDLSYREDGASPGWAWRDVLGAGKGQAHLYNNVGLVALLAGGDWDDGVNAGSRAVLADGCPWYVAAGIGVRLACDAA